MADAPPVPPKDTPKSIKMDIDSAPPSATKRKRDEVDDTVYEVRDGRLAPADLDAHTPKRSRQSDTEASDSGPGDQRNLRRKKKMNNLSKANLRHAAEQQRVRESRFQEGSLTDKPSNKPPSAFTRMIRTESGNIKQVDELMEGYNDDTIMAEASTEALVPSEVAVQSLAAHPEPTTKTESGGFFRFGRSFASSFHPVALWNKMWNETREDLIRQNEEMERKRKQKEEAEARYAEMKAAGQLGLKPVSNLVPDMRESAESSRPRDSAVVLDGVKDSVRTSTGSQLLPPPTEDIGNGDVTEAKAKGTFRSRFGFRKPSISNLKGGLKRVASDLNLAAPAGRESSSSVSPNKTDLDQSTLRRSTSKFDLKKQQKLSKRVSDLEGKLQLARRELDVALVEASPRPKLNNKYERFTPHNTLKRPKFIPGKLPSLPSERILMAEQLGFGDDELSPDMPTFDNTQPRKAIDLSEGMSFDNGEDTIKARELSQYPRRADSLFKLSDDKIDDTPNNNDKVIQTNKPETSELTQFTSESAMDPNSVASLKSDGASEPIKSGDYASLDAKLKALDKQVKIARKPAAKSKKRKSGADDDDKLFKPSTTTDDDDEWDEANGTPRKKRKSTGNNTTSSPHGQPKQRTRGNAAKSSPSKMKPRTSKVTTKSTSPRKAAESEEEYSEADDAAAGADEVDEAPARTSLDSQGQPLEPLYEVEEDIASGDPTKSAVNATQARYFGGRTRSNSPHKRARSVQPAPEETMLLRAAEVAQGRRGRSASPAPGKAVGVVSKTVTIEEGLVSTPNDIVQNITPPAEEQSKMTVTKTTVEVKVGTDGDFQWPEDVF
ncbi:hypothetical protein LTR97_003732 [Elasticomyces elasticus]|uniref:Uncharacterized protein n=1 Tax=Elasticomyces elasticus TaxID=574655 RepID=A0AAN7WBU4_9PEZI|nr:hypothetical protein LTR97_003732 [Elasticomyces elasticus]